METKNAMLLNSASELLRIAVQKNALQEESRDVLQEYNRKRNECDDIVKKIRDFSEKYADPTIQSSSLLFISAVKTNLQALSKKADEQMKNDEKAKELIWQIEDMKEEILKLSKSYPIKKYKTEEIPKDKLRELVSIILLINSEDYTFTEEMVFESTKDFHEMLKQSNDPVLTDLVFRGTITYNLFDLFLEKIS